ncbi:MAG: hypothetical protein JWL98_2185, partial [Xanthomonadaceae bacterium]|nr:hypothetical protein [Xanthomonadaceae bacterium]
LDGQAQAVELDLAATPGVQVPPVGATVAVTPLRYQVYAEMLRHEVSRAAVPAI